jgi:hypothetical protein
LKPADAFDLAVGEAEHAMGVVEIVASVGAELFDHAFDQTGAMSQGVGGVQRHV